MLLFFLCSCFYTNKCTQYQVPNKKMSPRRINQHSVLFRPTENIWLDQNIDYWLDQQYIDYWLDQQSSVSSLSFKLVNYLKFSIESCLELCNALLFLFLQVNFLFIYSGYERRGFCIEENARYATSI